MVGLEHPQPVRTHRTLFAGALVAISLFGDSYLYAVLPVYYAEAGVGLVAVGWLLSINRWVRFFTNPLAGVIGPRVGWGWAFAGALWLAAATTAGYGVLKGLAALLVVRALWGLCWSFLRLGGMAAVLADSPEGRRGRLMGLFTGVFRLGSVVGVAVGGYLADRLGFGPTALLFGAATALGALVASLPPALAGRWGAPGRNADLPASNGGMHTHWLPTTGPELAASFSASMLQLVVSGLVTGTLGLLVKERLGADVAAGPWVMGAATVTGLLLGSRFLIDLVVGPAVGHWADRRGRGLALGAATAVIAGALVVLGLAHSLTAISVAALALFGAATGAMAILDAWAGDLAGRAPGRFLPAYNTWLDLGAATGPIAGYYLAAQYGLAATYGSGIVALLLAGGLRVWLARREGED
ncbi:MAG: MFS transporter [Bacillota bacterium]